MWSEISPYSIVDEEGNLISYLQQEEVVREQEGRVNEKKKSFWKRLFEQIY